MKVKIEKKVGPKGSKIAELGYMINQLKTSDTTRTLIIGEREGNEGVSAYVHVTINHEHEIAMTDISPVAVDSFVEELLEKRKNTNFIQGDFVKFDDTNKFNSIVCISVLEHFGMKFDGKNMFDEGYNSEIDDIIHWNHDLVGLKKMTNLLKDDISQIIITVPAGRFMNCDNNGFPFLRYYTEERRELIKETLDTLGCELVNEEWMVSKDFKKWYNADVSVMGMTPKVPMNPWSPNAIWAFCIRKSLPD